MRLRKSILELIARDERRERTSEIIWTFGPLPAISLAVIGLGIWREHGVPKDLRPIVASTYWTLIGIGLVLTVVLAGQLLRTLYPTVRLSIQ